MKISTSMRAVHGLIKAFLCAGALLSAGFAQAQFEKGPNPTREALDATSGPFAVRTTTISRSSAVGFGGGTVYYPATAGSYGAIAVAPGFTAYQSSISWIGQRVASHGFVVITIDTNSTSDQPDSRGRQLKAALDRVVALSRTMSSGLYGKVDPSRLAVAGHSMGGGGALSAARDNPSYKAAVPLAPWHATKSWWTLRVPTLVMSGELDTVARVGPHALQFYGTIPGTTPKAYAELRNASHAFPQMSSYRPVVGRYMVSWFKRFVDNDLRYTTFLCGAEHQADLGPNGPFSVYRENCPY